MPAKTIGPAAPGLDCETLACRVSALLTVCRIAAEAQEAGDEPADIGLSQALAATASIASELLDKIAGTNR